MDPTGRESSVQNQTGSWWEEFENPAQGASFEPNTDMIETSFQPCSLGCHALPLLEWQQGGGSAVNAISLTVLHTRCPYNPGFLFYKTARCSVPSRASAATDGGCRREDGTACSTRLLRIPINGVKCVGEIRWVALISSFTNWNDILDVK